MNIAVFGGRFDPPHLGHLQVAQAVLSSTLGIDQVWFLPANTHPWRPIRASAQDRLNMVKLMQTDRIKASDIDIARGGETYTIETVRQLLQDKPNRYFWVCGIDQMKDLYRWKEYDELHKLIEFIVLPRKGFDEKSNLPPRFTLLKDNFVPNDISSSVIRGRVRNGESLAGFVTPEVEQYIKQHHLYE
ncbi:MAG: nicotinate (nicotinamide) nucleotide adenylyltransferase [Patescibacteria group bacterium]|nr:nicotinate (nicotinamide) nucleotide adenylyltransferase [Patescibacteria group bacterium]MDE2590732.1 nicotinate (nicotinamide) nucleotide adenylyltransferase [Patescibacteria group bacterium]